MHDLPLNVNYGPNGGADLTHVPPVSVEGLFFFFLPIFSEPWNLRASIWCRLLWLSWEVVCAEGMDVSGVDTCRRFGSGGGQGGPRGNEG